MFYTADDERLAVRSSGDDSKITVRDFDGRVLREWRGPLVGSPWTWVEDYVYDDARLIAAERQEEKGGRLHFHVDHLGSVRLITKADRTQLSEHRFFPFGIEKTDQSYEVNNFRFVAPPRIEPTKFTGHQRDYYGLLNVDGTDHLDYMHARYYDPNLGRFLSVDPTWESSDPSRPQTWNRYAYVVNNPINLIDPDGRNAFAYWLLRTVAQYAAREIAVTAGRTVLDGTKLYAMHVLADRKLLPRPQVVPPGVLSAQDPYVIDDSRITRLPDDRIGTAPDKRGNAPIGDDGYPVEIHHVDQKADGPLVEMTRTDHRGKGNFKPNHNNTGQTPSEIDRKSWLQAVKDYWKREWDRGRFADLPPPKTGQ